MLFFCIGGDLEGVSYPYKATQPGTFVELHSQRSTADLAFLFYFLNLRYMDQKVIAKLKKKNNKHHENAPFSDAKHCHVHVK